MKEEPQMAARTIGRILCEKVTRRGSRWRCIWPELRERCGGGGGGAVKEETGDASENKHAKMRRGGYEDAAGGLGGIRCKPGGWEGKGGRCKPLEVGGGCAPGRNRGQVRVARPHEMPLVNYQCAVVANFAHTMCVWSRKLNPLSPWWWEIVY